MYAHVFDSTAPLGSALYILLDFVVERSLTGLRIIALVIHLFMAGLFSVTLIRNRAFPENTYLPAFLFILISFFSFDTLRVSPGLLSQVFLLFALNRLMAEVGGGRQGDEGVLTLGVLLSFAVMSNVSSLVFVIAAVLVLILFTRTPPRRYALLVFGLALPHLLLISVYFLKDGHHSLMKYYYGSMFNWGAEWLISRQSLLLLGSLPFLYLLLSLFVLNREARFTKYQSQLVQVMILWFAFGFAQVFFESVVTPASFLSLAAPAAFFITHLLLLIRRRYIASLNLWVLTLGIGSMHYLTLFDKAAAVNYDGLFVSPSRYSGIEEQRVWLLADDLAFYQSNRHATAFLDWSIARPVLSRPDSYRNITLVHHALERDLPEVIIDPDNYLEEFFERLPAQKEKYQKTGYVYRRISN